MFKYLIPLALVVIGVGYAQVTINTEAETEFAPISTVIEQKQNDYFNQKGKFWQGIKTLDEPSEEAKDTKKKRKPTDVDEDWEDMGIPIPKKSKYSYQVDTYEGEQGHGYTTTIKYKDKGKIYMKVINNGPETYRERDWELYNPPK